MFVSTKAYATPGFNGECDTGRYMFNQYGGYVCYDYMYDANGTPEQGATSPDDLCCLYCPGIIDNGNPTNQGIMSSYADGETLNSTGCHRNFDDQGRYVAAKAITNGAAYCDASAALEYYSGTGYSILKCGKTDSGWIYGCNCGYYNSTGNVPRDGCNATVMPGYIGSGSLTYEEARNNRGIFGTGQTSCGTGKTSDGKICPTSPIGCCNTPGTVGTDSIGTYKYETVQ
jgi:hypothetical protein